ncbi:NAD(P)/FAD-dependent oxidoreductase [Nitratireductor sp. OM-1]|uniref:NAD(P)/FAD-dependent oxidoreductase n=1 Tax=Nitratireductor sp. OM-1 TaxID=1756988 RepID=UPI000DDF5AD1|nr:FAD-dependent oxidoreductase [Nitratireductor sp. OM-1]
MVERCIIVGGGHGGSQAAVSLRQEGYSGEIVLVSDEKDLPYHRPPLSKSYLKTPDGEGLVLRTEAVYRDNAVELELGVHAERIDVDGKRLIVADGRELGFTDLVLATGARARMPQLPGMEFDGIVTLRTMEDARRIRAAMPMVENVVIVGGGFIGMEMAHSCIGLGKSVTLIEAAPRVLARSVAPVVSAHVEERSRSAGIDLITSAQLAAIHGEGGKVVAVSTADGRRFDADMVVMGIGAVPNVELAAEAGLEVANGVVVDPNLRSSAPHIYAIGDCVSFDHHQLGERVRLESVQNATDHARHIARVLTGGGRPYAEVAWFWSDQGDMKIQTAGLAAGADSLIVSGASEDNAFSVYHFRGEKLVAVDSINRPADHMIARRLLGAGINPSAADIAEGAQRLKQLISAFKAN